MEVHNQQLRAVTTNVLALAIELRKGAIGRVMGMSDVELGLQAIFGNCILFIDDNASPLAVVP